MNVNDGLLELLGNSVNTFAELQQEELKFKQRFVTDAMRIVNTIIPFDRLILKPFEFEYDDKRLNHMNWPYFGEEAYIETTDEYKYIIAVSCYPGQVTMQFNHNYYYLDESSYEELIPAVRQKYGYVNLDYFKDNNIAAFSYTLFNNRENQLQKLQVWYYFMCLLHEKNANVRSMQAQTRRNITNAFEAYQRKIEAFQQLEPPIQREVDE